MTGSASVLQLISDTDGVRGAQVAALELADALRARGTSIRTVALRRGTSAKVLDVPVLGRGHRRGAVKAARVVLAAGSTTLWTAPLATIGTGRGFVYRSIGDASAWAHDPLRRARYRAAISRAAGVVVLWPGAVDAMADRFGVDRERIAVIPQAAPVDRFPVVTADRRAEARRSLGISADASIALFLGSLSAEKQIDVAIDAIADLADIELVVAGDGPLAAELRAHAERVAPGRVRFLGAVDDPRPALAAADLVVLASRTEGVPGVVVEAGLTGLPTVATAVGGVSSVVVDGVTGVLVPSGDASALRDGIDRARRDPSLGPAARTHCVGAFTLDAVVERWQAVLDAAMTTMA